MGMLCGDGAGIEGYRLGTEAIGTEEITLCDASLLRSGIAVVRGRNVERNILPLRMQELYFEERHGSLPKVLNGATGSGDEVMRDSERLNVGLLELAGLSDGGFTIRETEDDDIEAVAKNMAQLQVRRLPVLNRDKGLVGIVSLGDLSHRPDAEAAGEALRGVSSQSDRHSQSAV